METALIIYGLQQNARFNFRWLTVLALYSQVASCLIE